MPQKRRITRNAIPDLETPYAIRQPQQAKRQCVAAGASTTGPQLLLPSAAVSQDNATLDSNTISPQALQLNTTGLPFPPPSWLDLEISAISSGSNDGGDFVFHGQPSHAARMIDDLTSLIPNHATEHGTRPKPPQGAPWVHLNADRSTPSPLRQNMDPPISSSGDIGSLLQSFTSPTLRSPSSIGTSRGSRSVLSQPQYRQRNLGHDLSLIGTSQRPFYEGLDSSNGEDTLDPLTLSTANDQPITPGASVPDRVEIASQAMSADCPLGEAFDDYSLCQGSGFDAANTWSSQLSLHANPASEIVFPPAPKTVITQGSKPLTCEVVGCKETLPFKNQSDFKKHKLRHERPWRCRLCPMGNDGKPKGFGTRNDLERHAKSRHKIAPVSSVDRTYMCKAPGCPRPAKPWPRTDNFRQHCKRMHCHLDVDKLVAASLLPSQSEPISGEPSNTLQSQAGPNDASESAQAWRKAKNASSKNPVSPFPAHNLPTMTGLLTETAPAHVGESHNVSTLRNASKINDPPQLSAQAPTHKSLTAAFSSSKNTQTKFSARSGLHCHSEGPARDPRSGSGMDTQANGRLIPYDNTKLPKSGEGSQDTKKPTIDCSRHREHDLSNKSRSRRTSYKESPADRHNPVTVNTADVSSPDQSMAPSPAIVTTSAPSHISAEHKKALEALSTLQNIDSASLPPDFQRQLRSVAGLSIEDRNKGSNDSSESAAAGVQGTEASNRSKQGYLCNHEGCGKVKKTRSELRKHSFRHIRPYTCTQGRTCDRAFGSKNDWKRHERTMHTDITHQQGYWCPLSRVLPDSQKTYLNYNPVRSPPLSSPSTLSAQNRIPAPNVDICQLVLYEKEELYEHLHQDHNIPRPDPNFKPGLTAMSNTQAKDPRRLHRQEIKKKSRIGPGGIGGFWCGFCNSVVNINENLRGLEAWDLRYNHIDEVHFRPLKYQVAGVKERSREGSRVEAQGKVRAGLDWVVFGEGKTKREFIAEKPGSDEEGKDWAQGHDEEDESDDEIGDITLQATHGRLWEAAADEGKSGGLAPKDRGPDRRNAAASTGRREASAKGTGTGAGNEKTPQQGNDSWWRCSECDLGCHIRDECCVWGNCKGMRPWQKQRH